MTDHMPQSALQSPTPLAVPWTPPAQAVPQAQIPPAIPQAAHPQPIPPQQIAQPSYQAPPMQAAQAYQPAPQAFQRQPVQAVAAPTGYPAQAPTPPAYVQQPQQHMPPPIPPQNLPPMPLGQPITPEAEAMPKSKSPLANLLKRAPKTAVEQDSPKTGGSLFDKNFVFGLVAGTVLGFLVLPMVFGGSAEPAETYVPTAELVVPDATAGAVVVADESFVDVALAEETP